MQYPQYVSDTALDRRWTRVTELKRADPRRFQPNPLGPGYLTRIERYNEMLDLIEAEHQRRGHIV